MKRRNFVKQAIVVSGGLMIVPRHVLGKGFVAPSDKINIGIIGVGRMGSGHTNGFSQLEDAQIVAGSDVWISKQKAFVKQVEKAYKEKGREAKGIATFLDYEELINWPGLDAVVVATPDHWHAMPSASAMKSGKDVYCEKPLTHTVDEGKLLVKLASKHNRIFQTGSQQRSNKNFHKACTLVRNGHLGEIQKVLVNVGDPAIDYNLPEEQPADGLDWDRWCGPAPLIHYNRYLAPETNKVKFWPKWRDFKETGGGILADWGAHMFDIAQWGIGMDGSGPVKLIPPSDPKATRGLKLVYDNGIEMVHEDFGRGWGVRFIGTKGNIDISRQYFESTINGLTDKPIDDETIKLYRSDNHRQNWLDCIKNRSQPICPAEVGHSSNTINCIANIAYWLNRPLDWNPKKGKFKDKEANALLTKDNREPYA